MYPSENNSDEFLHATSHSKFFLSAKLSLWTSNYKIFNKLSIAYIDRKQKPVISSLLADECNHRWLDGFAFAILTSIRPKFDKICRC